MSNRKYKLFRLICRSTLALVTLMLVSNCWAESEDVRFFVLKPGATWTYKLRYWEEGRFTMEKVGENIQWIDGTVESGAHLYYRLRSKTTGFENASNADLLIRVAEDSVRTIDTGKTSPEEVLSLPLPAVPGRTWSIAEGSETWHYTLESTEPIEVPASRFEDCIAIVTTLDSETSKFKMSIRRELCAEVGMVRQRSKAIHKYGASNTEYTLLEFKP